MRIFKFVLKVENSQELELPRGSRILSVCEQNGEIVLYAMVDTTISANIIYDISIFGTGHPIPILCENQKFLGTVGLHEGKLMFHVFYNKR